MNYCTIYHKQSSHTNKLLFIKHSIYHQLLKIQFPWRASWCWSLFSVGLGSMFCYQFALMTKLAFAIDSTGTKLVSKLSCWLGNSFTYLHTNDYTCDLLGELSVEHQMWRFLQQYLIKEFGFGFIYWLSVSCIVKPVPLKDRDPLKLSFKSKFKHELKYFDLAHKY